MSGALSTKRQRTNTVGASAAPLSDHAGVFALVDTLPASIVSDTLKRAIAVHADIAGLVLEEHARLVAAEQAKVFDFDCYSKSAWKAINVTYRSLSSSRQYDASFDAVSSVQSDIKAIGKATTANASYGTKKSALETLRKIGKTIALSTDTIGHEVRKQFQWDTSLEKTTLRIAKSMTKEQREEVLTDEFEEKLKELEQLTENQCIFERLKDVRLVLSGEQGSSDDGTEDDGEGEEEEEEGEEEEQTDEGEESEDDE